MFRFETREWNLLIFLALIFCAVRAEENEPTDRIRIPGCPSLKDSDDGLLAPLEEQGLVSPCYCDNATADVSRESGGVDISCYKNGNLTDLTTAIKAVKADGREIWGVYFNEFAFPEDFAFPPNYWKDLGAAPSLLDISYCEKFDDTAEIRFHPESFVGLEESLEELAILDCDLDGIPVGLDKLTGLESLKMEKIPVEAVPRGAFLGLRNLKLLEIHNNRLSHWDEGAFDGLTSLETLSLGPGNAFNETIFPSLNQAVGQTLKVLRMQGMGVPHIRDGSFSNMKALKELILFNNALTHISSLAFGGLDSLELLDLKANQIQRMESRAFAPLKKLKKLELNGNKIGGLRERQFVGMERLESLDLRYNAISQIEQNAFEGMGNLEKLDLAFNSKLSQMQTQAFAGLKNLKWLDIANSGLTSILENVFDPLGSLVTLDLSFSPIASIRRGAFSSNKNLKELFIQDAYLSRLQPDVIAPLESLEVLDISGNQWICDDQLRQLMDSLDRKSADATASGGQFLLRNLNYTICASPPRLTWRPVASITEEEWEPYPPLGEFPTTTEKPTETSATDGGAVEVEEVRTRSKGQLQSGRFSFEKLLGDFVDVVVHLVKKFL